ncbi:MAG: transposase [Thermoguttaceae bacterium]|nr:transposase [Thermoguttaceae bacterium]
MDGGGQRQVDMRAVLNGMFYIVWSGCPWRILPKDYPP